MAKKCILTVPKSGTEFKCIFLANFKNNSHIRASMRPAEISLLSNKKHKNRPVHEARWLFPKRQGFVHPNNIDLCVRVRNSILIWGGGGCAHSHQRRLHTRAQDKSDDIASQNCKRPNGTIFGGSQSKKNFKRINYNGDSSGRIPNC